jgi:hypothetical protein
MFAKQVCIARGREADRDECIVLTKMLPSHDELSMPRDTGLVCTIKLRLITVHLDDKCGVAKFS